MNLSLLDPFILAQDCPEAMVNSLHCGHSTCIRFNRKGDLLASGTIEGNVIVFDTDTNGVARKLKGHTRQVQCVSWSADGRYLLSGSQDAKCILWDLKDGSRVRTVRFEAAVFVAELHPLDHMHFVAALFEERPMLVDMDSEQVIRRFLPSAPRRSQADRESATEKQLAQDAKILTTVTTFSHSGQYVIAGTNRGWLNFIDTRTCQTVFSIRVSNSLLIQLRLSGNGRDLAINASDKIIRTYKLPQIEEPGFDFENFHFDGDHKYQDIVNGLIWNNVAFSPSGEYLVASISMSQCVYVWETSHKSLEKILEGPRTELSAVEWHPHRPCLAATGLEGGTIYLWSVVFPQRWSALAPDFAEVEENEEYVEKEDEFDIHPVEEINKRILNQEDEDIDVLTIEPMRKPQDAAGRDRKDIRMEEFQMPVLLDLENSDSEDDVVAIGAGQFRRRSPGQGKEWALEEGATEPTATSEGPGTPRRTDSNASPNPRRRRGDV